MTEPVCPNCLDDDVESVDHKGRYYYCGTCANVWEVYAKAGSPVSPTKKKTEPFEPTVPTPGELSPDSGVDFP